MMVFKKGTFRSHGDIVRKNNIAAAKIIATLIKTTYGPQGMSKLMIDNFGEIAVTNDGATILNKMDIYHPVGKIIQDAAKTQDITVGDGTKMLVILVGELLTMAEKLLEQKVHPNVIIAGYRKALEIALNRLRNIANVANLNDRNLLMNIIMTSFASKNLGNATQHIANLLLDAIFNVIERRGENFLIEKDSIQIVKKIGKSLIESELIKGAIIEKEIVHNGMPKRIENAKILIINIPIKIQRFELPFSSSAKIEIKEPLKVSKFLEEEDKIIKEIIDKIVAVGANVVLSSRDINDTAQFFMAKAGILAIKRIKRQDLEKLAKATGAKIVTDLYDLNEEHLGKAELVEERKIGKDKLVFIEGCNNPKSVCIFLRGAPEKQLDDVERALNDAIMAIKCLINNMKYVAGGGATEEELSLSIRKEGLKYPGKIQLAILAFADALESIPKILAENSGIDPIEVITELREKHENGQISYGINVFSRKIEDMFKLGIIEPLEIKENALKSSFETTNMILRIDDVTDRRRRKYILKKT
ncbi:MAG: thermosome subunit beta [Candidatus Methanomethylicia archaeon]